MNDKGQSELLSWFIENSFDMEAKGNGFRFAPHIRKNAEIANTICAVAGGRMSDNFIMEYNSNKKKFVFDSKNEELKDLFKTKNKRIISLADKLENEETMYMDIYNQKNTEECGTLKGGMDHQQGNIVYNQLRIRKLTPKECWRLMGFATKTENGWSDDPFEKAEKVNSNSQLYKQAGNSIVVNVLEAIISNINFEEPKKEYDDLLDNLLKNF